MVDESAEGNLYSALRMREADLEKHISSGQGPESKDAAREKAREEAIKRLEEKEKAAKDKDDKPKPLPEFGSPEDFQLQQALNQLKGQPVQASKTMVERKEEKSKDDKSKDDKAKDDKPKADGK
jgi:carboxyl-terminal processing protease